MNKTHADLLKEISAIHEKKAADYATSDDPYSNFKYAASLADKFTDPVDRVFATLIGVKLARLVELTQPGRVPNNESLDDTFLDMTNYSAIWTSYRRDKRKVSPEPPRAAPPTHPYPGMKIPYNALSNTAHATYDNGNGICIICGKLADDCKKRESNALA